MIHPPMFNKNHAVGNYSNIQNFVSIRVVDLIVPNDIETPGQDS